MLGLRSLASVFRAGYCNSDGVGHYLGFLAWRKTCLVTASVVLILLALGGVGKHLVADASAYASTTTWVIAIGINVFGYPAFLAGMISAKRAG